ncbi:protein of unknown function [Taphrina deformans PYCC 5710]|uniref:Uncharacterized protein n=1 Tax=Taphrina deformans (strain PYCC 5710 / ATCC 11124 / CBS 356.35 / IMI 108563 / JCM 9778 / NBRC 8474) TaxID=1097556 RepID=R4XEF9_TAPDE|nr:protein of unknown function [Taphrina deformans PYCC 5710]|eukprot:CCG84052.1 protein of unknown function [Taphrina deformans PYCC 5710]
MNTNNFHLIFELIQNADGQCGAAISYAKLTAIDVIYPENVMPTLTINLSFDNKIVFEGNQMPFTEKNFNALCDAGLSSKRGDADTTGEKGLGFKAVFKVCDTVYIRSAGLSFSLSREGLGMIRPTWVPDDDFPVPLSNFVFQHTYIVLVFSDATVFKPHLKTKLLQDIRSMSSQTILFLRKLSIIKIVDRNGWQRQVIKGTNCPQQPSIKELKIIISSDKESGTKLIQSFFVVHEYKISNMPPEEKRHGQKSTVIQFAFPCAQVKNHWCPRTDLRSLKIFAFLPLCESPFKFSINADWVTATNREDFLHDNDWNLHILDALPELLWRSVQIFLKDHPEDLRFSCLRYIPGSNAPKGARTTEKHIDCSTDIFRRVAWQMISILQSSKCVLASDLALVKPSECLALRSEFSFKGRPILSLPNQIFAHKSYVEEDFVHLRTLGCMAFGKQNFLDSSETLSDEDLKARFAEHGAAWFLCFFKALASQVRWTDKQLERFRMLSLIPSTSAAAGSRYILTRPREQNLFLPSNNSELQETFEELDPDLIFVKLKSPGSTADIERFLTEKLHIKDATIGNVSQFLTNLHREAGSGEVVRSSSQILKHMSFWNLHRSEVDFGGSVRANMSVLTTTGRLRPLRKTLYDPSGSLESILSTSKDVFFLSRDLGTNQQLVEFLFECGLSVLPPLGSAPQLYLASNQGTALSFLQLLRWCLQEDPARSAANQAASRKILERYLEDKNFVAQMSRLKCLCKDGQYRQLKDTLFESRALKHEIDPALFLQLDSKHEKSYRKILKSFGVRFDLDLRHRLKVLEDLSNEQSTDNAKIMQAYKALEKELRKAQPLGIDVRKTFEQTPLLFRPDNSSWVKLNHDVYWGISSNLNLSAEDISHVFLLSRRYDEMRGLFHIKLGVPDFGLHDTRKLIEHRVARADTDAIVPDSLKQLLAHLFECYAQWLVLNIGQETAWLLDIFSLPVFLSGGRLRKNDGTLFFPDEFEVGKKLARKGIHILDVEESNIPTWRDIVTFINEKSTGTPIRFVSNMIIRDFSALGPRLYDEKQTATLRDHIPDIVRYIFHKSGRVSAEEAMERLCACFIFTVQSVFETIYLEVDDMPRIQLDAVAVSCMVEKTRNATRILLSSDDLDTSRSIENQIRLLRDLQKYLGQKDDFREFLVLIWQKPRVAIDHYMKGQSISSIPDELAKNMVCTLVEEQSDAVNAVGRHEESPRQGSLLENPIQCQHSAEVQNNSNRASKSESTGSDTVSHDGSLEQDDIDLRTVPLFRQADDLESEDERANDKNRFPVPSADDNYHAENRISHAADDNNEVNDNGDIATHDFLQADEPSEIEAERVHLKQQELFGLMNPVQERTRNNPDESGTQVGGLSRGSNPDAEEAGSGRGRELEEAEEDIRRVRHREDSTDVFGPRFEVDHACDIQSGARCSALDLQDHPAKRHKGLTPSDEIIDRLRRTGHTVKEGLLILENDISGVHETAYTQLRACLDHIRDLSNIDELMSTIV